MQTIPGKLLINFNGTGEEIDRLIEEKKLNLISYIHMLNLGTLEVPIGSEDAMIAELSGNPIVCSVEHKTID